MREVALRHIKWTALAMALLWTLCACGGKHNNPQADMGLAEDLGAGDQSDSPDVPQDIPQDADSGEDLAMDAEQDVSEDLPPDMVTLEPCPAPPEGEPPPGGRWALSTFHFNIQYVAGGLEGFDQIALGLPIAVPDFMVNEAQAEDLIITESFVPLLEILERNPELALTVEMQGLMIDIIAQRHPETLARMRRLVEAQQLEVASIHWSDQFFLAFGRRDMDKSWELTQASFQAADISLSRAVFTQEGQFGEGFAQWLAQARPDAIMVMARNLQRFHQESLDNEPFWKVRGLDVVLPRAFSDQTVDVTWSFFDDGELLATDELNPYLGRSFQRHEPSILEYERKLQCLHQNGYKVGRVSDYVDAMRQAQHAPRELPPFLDGTWQPRSTRGPLRWMGGKGTTGWFRHEQDMAVLRTCLRARRMTLALETLLAHPPAQATQADRDDLDSAWRELLLGQVSDARGVNPWYREIQYGLQHCQQAHDTAQDTLERLRQRLDSPALGIDTLTGEVQLLDGVPLPEPPEVVEAPLEVTIAAHGGRQPEIAWTASVQGPPNGDNPYYLRITWPAVEEARQAWQACLDQGEPDWACAVEQPELVVHIPRQPGLMAYRPAFLEELVRYTEADFDFQAEARDDAAWTTASDGLIELGPDQYLVKDILVAHMAVGFPAGEGRNGVIELRDETLQPSQHGQWGFWYTTSRERALALARRNHHPYVTFGEF